MNAAGAFSETESEKTEVWCEDEETWHNEENTIEDVGRVRWIGLAVV